MKTLRGFRWMGLLAWTGAGCIAMPKMLPADYFAPRRTVAIAVQGGLPTPTLSTDRPQNQIAGATWLARNEAMKTRMAGITPDRLHAAIRGALARQLADTFTVVEKDPQLLLTVTLKDWGWYVPTGRFGESQDIHFFRLSGTASIADPAQAGAEVYFAYNSTDTPLGDHLTKEKCEAALPQAAADFAAQVGRFILPGKPAPPP